MSDDLLVTVQDALDRLESAIDGSPNVRYATARSIVVSNAILWLRALVTRCEQAEVAAASWRQIADEAAEKLHALRQRHAEEHQRFIDAEAARVVEAQRHAEAVREAHAEGWWDYEAAFDHDAEPEVSENSLRCAWERSDARRKVGT